MKRRGFLREKLEGLSHYVRTWVPFYQERSSGGADFADLPIIDKRLLKARYKDFISAERAGLADYIADFAMNSASFPAGGSIERPGAHGLFFERTSGTSGIPFVSVKTSQERALMAIAQMKMRRAIDPGFEADKLYAFNHVGQRVLENSPVNYAPANLAQLYVNVAKKVRLGCIARRECS